MFNEPLGNLVSVLLDELRIAEMKNLKLQLEKAKRKNRNDR